jgi:hypothetical protein
VQGIVTAELFSQNRDGEKANTSCPHIIRHSLAEINISLSRVNVYELVVLCI